MTARTHAVIRSGLRLVIRDKNVSPKERMRAIERLMYLEGLLDENGRNAIPMNKPGIRPISDTNAKRIRELLAKEEGKKAG